MTQPEKSNLSLICKTFVLPFTSLLSSLLLLSDPLLGNSKSRISLDMAEGLAVAASVTGLLAFAIQSSKVIWNTLSGIQEAPAGVERLVNVVSNLTFLLEQLENLGKQNDHDGGTLSKELEVVISTCAIDLEQFQKQICRLQVSPDKNQWRRTWRSWKCVLEKEKLDSMRMVILQHHSALEGHLALAN